MTLGRRLIKSAPDSKRCEFDACKEVVIAFVVSCGDCAEVFEFVEEAFDAVSEAIEPWVECRDVLAVRHRLDVAPSAALLEADAQVVCVIGAVGEQDLALAQFVQHLAGAAPVMGLSLLSWRAIGSPSASTSAWILVVRPPRERPMQRDRPSFFGRLRHADGHGSKTSQSFGCRRHKPLKRHPEAGPRHPPDASG